MQFGNRCRRGRRGAGAQPQMYAEPVRPRRQQGERVGLQSRGACVIRNLQVGTVSCSPAGHLVASAVSRGGVQTGCHLKPDAMRDKVERQRGWGGGSQEEGHSPYTAGKMAVPCFGAPCSRNAISPCRATPWTQNTLRHHSEKAACGPPNTTGTVPHTPLPKKAGGPSGRRRGRALLRSRGACMLLFAAGGGLLVRMPRAQGSRPWLLPYCVGWLPHARKAMRRASARVQLRCSSHPHRHEGTSRVGWSQPGDGHGQSKPIPPSSGVGPRCGGSGTGSHGQVPPVAARPSCKVSRPVHDGSRAGDGSCRKRQHC